MINKYYIVFIFSVFAASLAQLLLKKGANQKYKNKINEYLNLYVISGYGTFIFSTLLTIIAYRGVDLKTGPVLNTLGYIFVMILSRMFLKEKISKRKVLSILLIVLGIIVFNL